MAEPVYRISVEFGLDPVNLPSVEQIQAWVRNALTGLCPAASLDLRIVDRDEIREANQQYRQIDRATNVLSFPADLHPGSGLVHLGDIMISAPVLAEEAQAQGKQTDAHWAHLLTHGVLHLLGMDHQQDDAALEMEALEQQILQRIGIANPYD